MNNRELSFTILFGTTLLLLLVLLSCADRDAPGVDTAGKLLGSFFEAQGYRVVSLDLGLIEGAPVAQKTYGKKRAFYVTVKRLVLEGKGHRVTRENGVVIIRQKTGAADEWEIERIPAALSP